MPASRYLGAPKWAGLIMRLLGKETVLPLVQGLERDGQVLLKPFCPPYYPTMAAAVEAFIAYKFGAQGVFRGGAVNSAWRDPQQVAQGIPAPSERAVAATIAYCDYVYRRYGRFPSYSALFRTLLGYQATRVAVDF